MGNTQIELGCHRHMRFCFHRVRMHMPKAKPRQHRYVLICQLYVCVAVLSESTTNKISNPSEFIVANKGLPTIQHAWDAEDVQIILFKQNEAYLTHALFPIVRQLFFFLLLLLCCLHVFLPCLGVLRVRHFGCCVVRDSRIRVDLLKYSGASSSVWVVITPASPEHGDPE